MHVCVSKLYYVMLSIKPCCWSWFYQWYFYALQYMREFTFIGYILLLEHYDEEYLNLSFISSTRLIISEWTAEWNRQETVLVSDIKDLFMTRTNVLKWYIYCFSGAKALIWQTYRPFCTNYWLLWCICLESYKLFTFSRKMLFHLYSHKEIELKNSVWAVLITSRALRRCKNAT